MTLKIINNKTAQSILTFSIFLLFCVIILISYNNALNITSYNITEKSDKCMKTTEKIFEKKYPLGNDFFTIVHYPKYSSFFDQFVKNKYYVHKNSFGKILGTFCVSEFKNKLKYICDLKTLEGGKNLTFKFMFKYYYDLMFDCDIKNIGCQMFGIVMQPNKIIDNITKKYCIAKCENLLLYQISYEKYLEIKKLLEKVFGNHFFVDGYKKLIMESTKNELKICHLATLDDLQYVKTLQNKLNDISKHEIMFCIPSKNKYVEILNKNNVIPSSTMTIFSILNRFNNNLNFIRTYMI